MLLFLFLFIKKFTVRFFHNMENIYITSERHELKNAELIKFVNNSIIIGKDAYYNDKKIKPSILLCESVKKHSETKKFAKFRIFKNNYIFTSKIDINQVKIRAKTELPNVLILLQRDTIKINDIDLRRQLIKISHVPQQTANHLSLTETYHKLKKTFFWPGLGRDIDDHIKACSTCSENDPGTIQPFSPVIQKPAYANSTVLEQPIDEYIPAPAKPIQHSWKPFNTNNSD